MNVTHQRNRTAEEVLAGIDPCVPAPHAEGAAAEVEVTQREDTGPQISIKHALPWTCQQPVRVMLLAAPEDEDWLREQLQIPER
ncbi:MAG: hypothetical protein Q7R40_12195 [Phaeospirillum sp.]|nr:hypothetical protein [Phaeospirillum sp.]